MPQARHESEGRVTLTIGFNAGSTNEIQFTAEDCDYTVAYEFPSQAMGLLSNSDITITSITLLHETVFHDEESDAMLILPRGLDISGHLTVGDFLWIKGQIAERYNTADPRSI